MTRFILLLALTGCSVETTSHKPARYRYSANGSNWYLDPVTKTWGGQP